MEILTLLVDMITLIFAILGVFIGIELVKLRHQENEASKAVNSRFFDERKMEDLPEFQKNFNPKLLELSLGKELIKAFFQAFNKSAIEPLMMSSWIHTHRDHLWMPLSRLIPENLPESIGGVRRRNIIKAMIMDHGLLILSSVLISICLPLVFKFHDAPIIAGVLIFILIVSFLILTGPAGLYKDNSCKDHPFGVIGVFFLGRPKYLHSVFNETFVGKITFTAYVEFRCLGLDFRLYQKFEPTDIKTAAEHYVMLRKFLGSIDGHFSIIEHQLVMRQAGTLVNDFRFNFIRMVVLINQRLQQFIQIVHNLVRRSNYPGPDS